MDAKDYDRLTDGWFPVVGVEAALNNFVGRNRAAGLFWSNWMKAPDRAPESAKRMKVALTHYAKLVKDAKATLKALDQSATSGGGDAKMLAMKVTARQYRDKVVYKHLVPVLAYEKTARLFVSTMNDVIGDGYKHPVPPGAAAADVKVSYDSIVDFLEAFDKYKKALAKI